MGRGAGRKIVQNAIFRGKRHDNKILKVKILLSRNFVVMAQAPKERGGFPSLEKGQFPLGKVGAKATQNGNHDLVHV